MDVKDISEIKDGESTPTITLEAPSALEVPKQNIEGAKKKRRRGKSKRNIMKPFSKMPWQERRKYENSKRNYRYRKLLLAKTHAPFNNNQFLMEIHKPEPENFETMRTASARTRDSSFSVDSEDNYFFSLPEDEEEYLTKEFSSVYEDAQSERLSNMTKSDLIQEYLLLEAKYDNLVKRTERSRPKTMDEDKDILVIDKDTSTTEGDVMLTDKDTSGTSIESSITDETSIDMMQRLKDQEDKIHELQAANEKLLLENEHLRRRAESSSSEDSESDSSTSMSDSSSSRSMSPVEESPSTLGVNGHEPTDNIVLNGVTSLVETANSQPLVNGFHSPNDVDLHEDP